jgi:putative ABC transport system permease protein
VRKFLEGANPVGRTLSVIQQGGKPDRIYQIVGLVKDTKYFDLREEFVPIVFLPDAQDDRPGAYTSLVIRSDGPLPEVVSSVKRSVAEVNPAMAIIFRVFETSVRETLLRERLMAMLSGFFGFLAAVLAMVGLYGVISYMVIRRTNEIGVRMALGAGRSRIVKMIMRESAVLLGIGVAIGAVLALVAGTTARALLFGLRPSDPATITLAVAALAVVAMLASFLPARRAAALDPMQALRDE